MNVFELDKALIERYSSFARSFSKIRASEIEQQVSSLYEDGKFWPDPLITINPRFEKGRSIDQLAAEGVLDPKDVMGADYPSETFRVLQKNEIAKHGEYRTRRLVLGAYDALVGQGMRPRTEGYR